MPYAVPAGPPHLEPRKLLRPCVPQVVPGAECRLPRLPQAHHSIRRACGQGGRSCHGSGRRTCRAGNAAASRSRSRNRSRCRRGGTGGPPEATIEPSGDHATRITESACPWNAATCMHSSTQRGLLGWLAKRCKRQQTAWVEEGWQRTRLHVAAASCGAALLSPPHARGAVICRGRWREILQR